MMNWLISKLLRFHSFFLIKRFFVSKQSTEHERSVGMRRAGRAEEDWTLWSERYVGGTRAYHVLSSFTVAAALLMQYCNTYESTFPLIRYTQYYCKKPNERF